MLRFRDYKVALQPLMNRNKTVERLKHYLKNCICFSINSPEHLKFLLELFFFFLGW